MINSNFVWLLDREVGGLGAFEDLVHINRGTPIRFGAVGSIRHQAAAVGKIFPRVDCRQPVFESQVGDLFLIGID